MTLVTNHMHNMTTEELVRYLRLSDDEFECFIADRMESLQEYAAEATVKDAINKLGNTISSLEDALGDLSGKVSEVVGDYDDLTIAIGRNENGG